MTLSLIVYAVITSGLLAVGAGLAQALLRSSIPGTRLIWAAAIAASVLILAAAPSRILGRAARPSAPVATDGTTGTTGMSGATKAGGAGMASLDLPMSLAARLAGRLPDWTPRALGGLWLLGAAGSLGLLVLNYRAHRRRAARAPRHVLDGTPVRVTESFGPAVVGVWGADIVVPRWLLARPGEEQALVVRHERSHVAAGDPALLLAGCVATALMPWNPASWYMLARLRLAIEVDCDRRVLRAGAPARAYGALLIELTSALPATRVGAPAFACRPSHLERRIVAMTARPLTHRRTRMLAAGAIAALALITACEADLPTAAQVEAMDANAVEEVVIPSLGIDPANIVYEVDGVVVDRSVVMAMDASTIEAVAVLRKDVPRMIVTTRKEGELRVTPLTKDLTRVDGMQIQYKEVEEPLRKPLYIIDGVLTDDVGFRQLEPSRIENVEVLKGDAAQRQFGARAADGVIQVTTRAEGAKRPFLREEAKGTLKGVAPTSVKRPAGAPTIILRRDSSAVNVITRRDSTAPSVLEKRP